MLEQWVHADLQPDLTILFDVAIDTARQRLADARSPDKFEQQGSAFFERTRAEYLRRAAAAPSRFRLIDASQSLDQIKNQLEDIIIKL